MNRKQYTRFGIIVIAGMGALMGWSISRGNTELAAILPLVTALVVAAIQLSMRKVKGVFVDERTYLISEKASRIALQIFVIICVVTGLALMVLGQYKYPEVLQTAYTLTFFASALSVLYVVFYGYYSRKYGG